MGYKKDLSQEELEKWENIKNNITIDRKERIFRDSKSLGNCSVSISFTDGKLCLEIIPIETPILEKEIEGVIVNIDEDACHISSIIAMIENAKQVEDARRKGHPLTKELQNSVNIANDLLKTQ